MLFDFTRNKWPDSIWFDHERVSTQHAKCCVVLFIWDTSFITVSSFFCVNCTLRVETWATSNGDDGGDDDHGEVDDVLWIAQRSIDPNKK